MLGGMHVSTIRADHRARLVEARTNLQATREELRTEGEALIGPAACEECMTTGALDIPLPSPEEQELILAWRERVGANVQQIHEVNTELRSLGGRK
jgi:hypothetical protein